MRLVRRMTLGRYGELTVEQARKRAQHVLGQVAIGIDPVAERHKAQLRGITLAEAYRDFLHARKALKPSTRRVYDQAMHTVLKDWLSQPLPAITRRRVAERHREIGEQRGEQFANGTLRVLRAVLNFAIATYRDDEDRAILLENPVVVLSQTRAWYRTERRQTVIKVHQLRDWYRAVESLRTGGVNEPADVVADYLVFLLFTGLRAREAATLPWSQIDLLAKSYGLPDPKNRVPITLPLSDVLCELLIRRQQQAINEYVFPGRYGAFVEPKRQVQHVREHSGVLFTLHDLRRTFITIAESLDTAPYAIKRLVNHKIHNDVTAGYIISDVERLRGPLQTIADFLQSATGIDQTNRVVLLRKSR